MSKSRLFVLLLLIGCLTPLAQAHTKVTTCLDFDPVVINDNGREEWVTSIKLLKALLDGQGLQLDHSLRANFARCAEMLKTGQIDLLYGLDTDEHWNKHAAFVPLWPRSPLFVYSLQALNKNRSEPLHFTMHRGFQVPRCALATYPSAQFSEVETTRAGMKMVAFGRVSGVLASEREAKLESAALSLDISSWHATQLCADDKVYVNIAISRRSPIIDLAPKLTEVVEMMRNRGELKMDWE